MDKRFEGRTEVNGTFVHYRAYVDPSGREKPVLVVEGANRGVPLDQNREAVGKELSARLHTTPDKVTFLEQTADGSLKETKFDFAYTQTITPFAHDVSREDAARSPAQGEAAFSKIDRYNMNTTSINRAEMETRVGQKLESSEMRQNKEFSQMTGPSINRELERER